MMSLTKLIGQGEFIDQLSGIQSELTRQNSILELMSSTSRAALLRDMPSIAHIVRNGDAPNVFDIGDQVIQPWKDIANNVEYENVWDVVKFGNVTLQDGETVPGMCIQQHYATPVAIPFDYYQAIEKVEEAVAPGTYYYVLETAYGPLAADDGIQFTTTIEIPAGGRICGLREASAQGKTVASLRIYTYASATATTPLETLTITIGKAGTNRGVIKAEYAEGNPLNIIGRAAYGSNRYKYSAVRNWLNSSAGVGEWYEDTGDFNMAPPQAGSMAGYMSGFNADFISAIKPVKIDQATATVDGGVTDTMYDRFFLPSLEQIYVVPQVAGVEGEYWDYWKRATGATAPQPTGSNYKYPARITYGIENKTQAATVQLRSALRGGAAYRWCGSASGFVNSHGTAYYAYRCAPACWIC